MKWFLQPHNYAQARGSNWYNVGYRRTGVYKGMGQIPTDVNIVNQFPSEGVNYGVDSSGNVWNLDTGQMRDPGTVAGDVSIVNTFRQGNTTYGIDPSGNVYPMRTPGSAAGIPGGAYSPWLIAGAAVLVVALMARR